MKDYQQLKSAILKLFKEAVSLAEARNDITSSEYLKSSGIRLRAEKLLVVVCGEFKQGKSSLINAFLNEQNLFPVDVDITTNLVSTIAYGEPEEITVYIGDVGKEKIEKLQRNQIPNYVTEKNNKNNSLKARLLSIESPNDVLRSGLVLVDTPGVGGLNASHTDMTYAFIPNADVVLFVSDAYEPLSNPELDFIKIISNHCSNIIFVLTKIDNSDDYHSVESNNRQKLSNILGVEKQNVNIVPVSSQTKLTYLETHDPEDLEDSNFLNLENELWKLLNEGRGYIFLMAALGHLNSALENIRKPLQVEWATCKQKSKEDLDSLESQLAEVKKRLQNLLDKKSTWQIKLSDGISDIQKGLTEKFQDDFLQIRRQIEDLLESSSVLQDPDQIVNFLEIEINAVTASLSKELSFQAEMLQTSIEESVELSLSLQTETLVPSSSSISLGNTKIHQTGIWSKTLDATRSGLFTGIAGATIGGMLGGGIGLLFGGVGAYPGWAIGSGIGAALGKVAGIFTGAKQTWSQVSEKDKIINQRAISRTLYRAIEDSSRETYKELINTIKKLERTMRDELINRIQREKNSFEKSLSALESARKLSYEQATHRAAELEKSLYQINEIRKNLEDLMTSVETLNN
jgi:GTP-binding protein EngB required for normal cell division